MESDCRNTRTVWESDAGKGSDSDSSVTMLSDKHSLSLKSPLGHITHQCPRLSLKSEGVHLSTHPQQAQLGLAFPFCPTQGLGAPGTKKGLMPRGSSPSS